MAEFSKKSFYREVTPFLEEIEALYEEYDFDEEEYGEEGTDEYAEHDALTRFINFIRDSKEIAESY